MTAAATPIGEYVMWGATGQAVVLDEFLRRQGGRLTALFDSDPNVPPPFPNVPVWHGREGFLRWLAERGRADSPKFCVAIGGEHGRARAELGTFLLESGLCALAAIHPQAIVASDALCGRGVQVLAGAIIGARAVVGDWCILNTAASADHESRLGTGVHLAPGARLAGLVTVEDYAFIGTGAVVLPRLTIGRGAIVGAGSVVTHDVPPGTVVCGNPARHLRQAQL